MQHICTCSLQLANTQVLPFLLHEKITVHQLVGVRVLRKMLDRVDRVALGPLVLKIIRAYYDLVSVAGFDRAPLGTTCPPLEAPLLELDGPGLVRQARERLLVRISPVLLVFL